MAPSWKLIATVVFLALPAIVSGAALQVLDNGTSLDNLTVAPGPVTLQLEVRVTLGAERVTALTGGIEVGSADAGRFQIDSYVYTTTPYGSVPFTPMITDLGTDHAGSCQDNDPSGVMNSATGGNTTGGVGFFASNWDPFAPPGPITNPFADEELIGVLTISSVTDVSDGESFTFSLNGDLVIDDSTYLEPPTSNGFTLNVVAAGTPPVIVNAWSVKESTDLVTGPGVIGYGIPMTTGLSPEAEPRMGGPTLLVFEFDTDVNIDNALATFAYPFGLPTSGISTPTYGQYGEKLWTQAMSIFPAQALPTDYAGRTDTLTVAMTGVLHMGVTYGATACLKVTVSGVRDAATLTDMAPITYITLGLQGDSFGLGGAIGGDGSNNPTDIYQMRLAQSVMGGAIHLDWGAQFQFDLDSDSGVTPTDVYQARLNGGYDGACAP